MEEPKEAIVAALFDELKEGQIVQIANRLKAKVKIYLITTCSTKHVLYHHSFRPNINMLILALIINHLQNKYTFITKYLF